MQNHEKPNRFFFFFFHTNKQEKEWNNNRAHCIVKKENPLFPFRLKNGHAYRICYENHRQEDDCLEVSTNTIFLSSVKKGEKKLSNLGI